MKRLVHALTTALAALAVACGVSSLVNASSFGGGGSGGAPSTLRLTNSTTQSVANNSFTQLSLDTVLATTGSSLTLATNTVTCHAVGVVIVTVTATTGNYTPAIDIQVGTGAGLRYVTVTNGNTAGSTLSGGCGAFPVTSGDVITFYMFQNSGGSATLQAGNGNLNVNVCLIGG